MYVYLRIFLACVSTQLVKAFVIKRLNIYCLVQTVSPAEREALLGEAAIHQMRPARLWPSSLKLICVLLACRLQPSSHSLKPLSLAQFTWRQHTAAVEYSVEEA